MRKCRRGRVAAFAAILALATTVVWGETWAIEHAPALPTGLVHVLGDSCGVSAVPFVDHSLTRTRALAEEPCHGLKKNTSRLLPQSCAPSASAG